MIARGVQGLPRFILHDLRKLVATIGEKLGLDDAVLRRILNHTAPKTDVLHRHYVGLNVGDVADGLRQIQEALLEKMQEKPSKHGSTQGVSYPALKV
jgi:hypothetical protein